MSNKVIVTLFFSGLTIFGAIGYVEPQAPPSGTSTSTAKASVLERILTDQRLWGDDAFAVFGTLDRWKNVGETSIVIHPDKVAGGMKTEKIEDVKRSVAQMVTAMKVSLGKLRPEYNARYRDALTTKAPALKVNFLRFREDDSFRVVLQRDGGVFLKKGVKISAVLEIYGKPEKTTTEVVHSQGDRRPAILTLHHYANSAIKFVESDLAPVPGLVDRVVVDVVATSDQVFGSSR